MSLGLEQKVEKQFVLTIPLNFGKWWRHMAKLQIWIPETLFLWNQQPSLIGKFLHENWSIKTEILVLLGISNCVSCYLFGEE